MQKRKKRVENRDNRAGGRTDVSSKIKPLCLSSCTLSLSLSLSIVFFLYVSSFFLLYHHPPPPLSCLSLLFPSRSSIFAFLFLCQSLPFCNFYTFFFFFLHHCLLPYICLPFIYLLSVF